jgi:hypothetical protein
VELATAEQPADALAAKRLDAIYNALQAAGFLRQGAAKQPAVLQANEKQLLSLQGVQVNDIMFVKK